MLKVGITHSALMVGFADELAGLGGMEKTADWETALKGLLIGGLIGGGVGFGGAKAIAALIEKNKHVAAMMGAALGASMGISLGSLQSKPEVKLIQTGPYQGLPEGTRYSEVQ